MEYTIHELAQLSGITVRTLHHYDSIGLLHPVRREENGYRMYGENEVNLLQQILFYRELGFPLKRIKQIVYSDDYDQEKELGEQLALLVQKKNQLDVLIANVKKTMETLRGGSTMSDEEKFSGLKQYYIAQNEKKYGDEIRKRYGPEVVDESNERFAQMSQTDWEDAQRLNAQILSLLGKAFATGNPAGADARKVCELHRRWLCMFWGEENYSGEKHVALAQGYVADKRFTEYYDKAGNGCTEFLRDAITLYVMN